MGRGFKSSITLLVLLIFIIQSTPFENVDVVLRSEADYPDPPGAKYINDTIFFVTENFTVETGEYWVIQNSTIMFNCSCDGELGITVKMQGTLTIKNGSLLTLNRTGDYSNNHGFNYFINCTGTMSIIDSNISYAGWGHGNQSGVLGSIWTTSTNSTFFSCFNGIYVQGWALGNIDDTDFIDIPGYGVLISGECDGRVDLRNCSFVNIGEWGIKNLDFGSPQVSCYDTLFLRCKGGVNLSLADDSNFVRCSFIGCRDFALYLEPYVLSAASYGDFHIEGNKIMNSPKGVYVQALMTSSFRDNEIINCSGVALNYGGMFWVTENNQIIRNCFDNCSLGISASSTQSDDLLNNKFIDCGTGAFFRSMGSMVLHNNTFSNSIQEGMVFHSSSGSNTIYENWFLNNTVHTVDGGAQTWDLGGRGNFWSGLVGYYDNNGDGIYDKPYWIDGNSVDRYPLVGLPGQRVNEPIQLGELEDRSVYVREWINLTFTAFDPDGDEPYFEAFPESEIEYELDRETGEFSYKADPEDVGSVTVVVTVTDNNGSMDQDEFTIEVLFRNYPPEVEPIPVLEVHPGNRKIHQLRFSDPNGDEVSVRIEFTDAPFSITINTYSQLSFQPWSRHEGEYIAILNFSDNNGTFTVIEVKIIVLSSNTPPQIISIDKQSVELGNEFNYQVQVIENDPDAITYAIDWSGNGLATINSTGFISIIPGSTDLGNRTVVVEVDDNNGSTISISFSLFVYKANFPPESQEEMNITVEAGDEMMIHFNVTDPENDPIVIISYDRLPYWITIEEEELTMTLTPLIYEIGFHELSLLFSDQISPPSHMSVAIHVTGTQFPPFEHTATIEMNEREKLDIDLDWGYEKNGTQFFDVKGLEPFMDLKGSILSVHPQDGDNGDYLLNISYGIVNGTNMTGQKIRVIIYRNLSTLWTEVSLDPDMESYEMGDVVVSDLQWGGYDIVLDFQWVWEVDGNTYERINGDISTVHLNFTGNWELFVILDGIDEPLYFKEFVVIERSDEKRSIPLSVIIFNIIMGFIFAALGVVGFLVGRKRLRSRRNIKLDNQQEDFFIPQGFKSAPSFKDRLDQGQETPLLPQKGNPYTEVTESTQHDTSDLRGEKGAEEGPKA